MRELGLRHCQRQREITKRLKNNEFLGIDDCLAKCHRIDNSKNELCRYCSS